MEQLSFSKACDEWEILFSNFCLDMIIQLKKTVKYSKNNNFVRKILTRRRKLIDNGLNLIQAD
jgi:hypothetical protein